MVCLMSYFVKGVAEMLETNEIEKSEEYIQNKKQIDCIKKVLIERANVPKKLIDWLIETVQENEKLKYKLNNIK